jgi:hypothetical protein
MGGISSTTAKALSQEPDLDQGLYNQQVPPQNLSNGLRKSQKFYTPPGKTPQQIQQDQAAAQENYLRNLQKNRRR